MTDEERQEANVALHYIYKQMGNLGFDAIRMIAGYLEEGSPSYSAVQNSAWGNHGIVDREDMLTELVTSYFEKKTGGANQEAGEALMFVADVMNRAGYHAIDQLAGYLISGDLSYITIRENARSRIGKIGRYDLVMELLTSYFK